MLEQNTWTGQILTILMLATALGFDAFSLGIGIGLRGIRYRSILMLSGIIGVFHVIMPIGGMMMGKMMSHVLGDLASIVAGALLVILGLNMIYNAFKEENVSILSYQSFWGMLLLAISVSVDSFSVGITLGMFISQMWLTVAMFGICGMVMSVLGLSLGKKVRQGIGEYGEAFGGVILVVFGVYFIV